MDVSDPSVLENLAITHGFRLGRPENLTFSPDGRSLFFLRSGPRSSSRDLFELSLQTGEESTFLTAESLLSGGTETVSPEERARRERMRLSGGGITAFQFTTDGSSLLVPYSGRLFYVNRATRAVRELATHAEGAPVDPRFSPDSTKLAVVRNGDVYVTTISSGAEVRLTRRANDQVSYGEAEFVAQEEMARYHGYWWSPDSRTILLQESDTTAVETLHISDPMHPEADPVAYSYPRAGHDNVRVRLFLIASSGGRMTPVEWDREAFPYVARVVWSEHREPLVLVQNRTQTEERLLSVDARTGTTRTLLVETDSAWLNIDAQMPRVLRDGRFLWTSERRGAWQLEIRTREGEPETALTLPEMGYRGLYHVDEAAGFAYVGASRDPSQAQIFRVSLSATSEEPTLVSHGDGVHAAVFASANNVFVDTAELANGDVLNQVRRFDGTEGPVVRSLAETPRAMPQLQFVTVDDALELRTVVIRPRNFDASLRYPVIVAVYGGPGYTNVRQTPYRYLDEQWMADHGYIVVSIDGRGTPFRGREWERAIARDVITTPLADQVRGLRALGERFPEMDLSRVGIYGWSFGGYFSAMAVLREPSVFHAAVAGAPVTDWHDYDTHYTERFMGLPAQNEAGYRSTSCITWAPQLTRPLMLVHGTADDNVYFLHSIRLADALLRAGKTFDFLPLSGFTHMVPDPTVSRNLNERISSFFEAHVQRMNEARAPRN